MQSISSSSALWEDLGREGLGMAGSVHRSWTLCSEVFNYGSSLLLVTCLFRFSVSSWVSFGSSCVSRNLCLSSGSSAFGGQLTVSRTVLLASLKAGQQRRPHVPTLAPLSSSVGLAKGC